MRLYLLAKSNRYLIGPKKFRPRLLPTFWAAAGQALAASRSHDPKLRPTELHGQELSIADTSRLGYDFALLGNCSSPVASCPLLSPKTGGRVSSLHHSAEPSDGPKFGICVGAVRPPFYPPPGLGGICVTIGNGRSTHGNAMARAGRLRRLSLALALSRLGHWFRSSPTRQCPARVAAASNVMLSF